MKPIQEEEWINTINSMSNNKAPGISEITYDLIKKSSNNWLQLYRELTNQCLLTSKIPKNWKIAQIYPIPKPEEWNWKINKTHPITLLECPRKILFKVLTNRLNNILANNPYILDNNNFAALPGCSTQEPIHLLNILMENARIQDKELWILFQDMSKAYDRVNRKLLFKALERIRIPTAFINLLKDALENRSNKILTAVGDTEEYIMTNGIDQGEIISPTL